METFQMVVLLTLRAEGPCSCRHIQEITDKWGDYHGRGVYKAMYALRGKHFARRLGEASYDVTKRGRKLVDEYHWCRNQKSFVEAF